MDKAKGDGEEMIKHNCCKENKFEWSKIDLSGKEKDTLRCKICGREFEEKQKQEAKKWKKSLDLKKGKAGMETRRYSTL